MDAFLANEPVRRAAASIGVLGSVALAFFYVLVPALTVPFPAAYGFFVAWAVPLVLSLRWWGSHPWGAFAVPVIGLPIALAVLWFGGEYLGWAP
jgi:hypothetical protein